MYNYGSDQIFNQTRFLAPIWVNEISFWFSITSCGIRHKSNILLSLVSTCPLTKTFIYHRSGINLAWKELMIEHSITQGILTFINSTMPDGRDVLLSLLKYSMISFVCKPTETAAYKEYAVNLYS